MPSCFHSGFRLEKRLFFELKVSFSACSFFFEKWIFCASSYGKGCFRVLYVSFGVFSALRKWWKFQNSALCIFKKLEQGADFGRSRLVPIDIICRRIWVVAMPGRRSFIRLIEWTVLSFQWRQQLTSNKHHLENVLKLPRSWGLVQPLIRLIRTIQLEEVMKHEIGIFEKWHLHHLKKLFSRMLTNRNLRGSRENMHGVLMCKTPAQHRDIFCPEFFLVGAFSFWGKMPDYSSDLFFLQTTILTLIGPLFLQFLQS